MVERQHKVEAQVLPFSRAVMNNRIMGCQCSPLVVVGIPLKKDSPFLH